jgi:succinate dehydrogenase / fumarate reductase, membrane anchor subunit
MFKYQHSAGSGSFSWVVQRITGIVLVVMLIGHYILMHYNPESGHTYDAVLARMQSNWYRVLDLTFVVLAMYHGLNGIWSIFRDYKLKPWQTLTIMSLLIIFGLAFTLWGIKTILDIPYISSNSVVNLAQ